MHQHSGERIAMSQKDAVEYRLEKDLIGEKKIPAGALYGIYTQRAIDNFPLSHRRVHPSLIHAFGAVKLACLRANAALGYIPQEKAAAIAAACEEMMEGRLDEHIVADALQGGAGTSTNMNVNEVLANRALQLIGRQPGDYATISPLDDVNMHQSTNDTYPTALKVAAIKLLRDLERSVVALLEEFQRKEKQFAHVVKIGRTQLQDAVLITLGREMSAYAEAFGRDRWRIYKCEERLRVVNLGGTAVGTGLAAPRQYIFAVVEHLREITGMGLARAENLIECTQNTDVFVEVSGILKACASNLIKSANDIRLLSSGPDTGIGEIRIPAMQAGSSIMPGKVNPVIPEAVAQAAIQVMSNDQTIAVACSLGNLELNQFMPLIADALLSSFELLSNAADIFRRNCVAGIEADEARCARNVENATASVTALVEVAGYERAQAIAKTAREKGISIKQSAIESGAVTAGQFDEMVSPENVTKLGSNIRKEK